MRQHLFITIILLFLSVACTTKHKSVIEDQSVNQGDLERSGDSAESEVLLDVQEAKDSAALKFNDLNDPNSPLYERIIYFDYDSSEVQARYQAIIDAHARYLLDHSDISATLAGHTDERGSREYNLALGERRAWAIKQRLLILGVFPEQIKVVSYGEELPQADGHDETSWSRNRRVEIQY